MHQQTANAPSGPDERWISFRAWNGRRMRAQARGDGLFLVSLGLELRWRRLPYIKFRDDQDAFWTAVIDCGRFLTKPAKGEPVILRTDRLSYRGWAEPPAFDRWISRWSPETGLFEHSPVVELPAPGSEPAAAQAAE